jgi:hypothetical protein
VSTLACAWSWQLELHLRWLPMCGVPTHLCTMHDIPALWLQLCFAVMAISSHPALESIPPLVYSTLRIAIALPLLLLSARLQVWTGQLACSNR